MAVKKKKEEEKEKEKEKGGQKKLEARRLLPEVPGTVVESPGVVEGIAAHLV